MVQTVLADSVATRADRFAASWQPNAPTAQGHNQTWLDADHDVTIAEMAHCDAPFALAVTDSDGLRLARDPIGHRSVYWSQLPDKTVVFGSSIHGVVADPRVPRQLDLLAVADYLAYSYVPSERTLIAGIHSLAAGALRHFRAETATQTQFWSLPAVPPQFASEPYLRDQLRATLEQAVRRALPTGPVCATLSGGIDSSLVLALACRLRAEPIDCLSVSFGREHANELPFSQLVAQHLGAAQQVVEVSANDIATHFDATVGALSEPNGDPLTVPNYLLFQRAAQLGGVVLNGEGGDPCFGGPKNAPMLLAALLGDDEAPLDRERNYLRAHQRLYDDLPTMLTPRMLDAVADSRLQSELSPWFCDPRWPGLLDQLMAINVSFKGAHHILPKVDHLSFAHGCSPRSPLFDKQLVQLSMQIPAQLKRSGAIEKYLLKQAVRDLLPPAIVDRPKSGMLVPVESWFSGPLLPFAKERLLDGLAPLDLVRRDWLEKLLANRLGGLRPRRGIKIWQLLTLEAWLRTMGVQA